MQKFAVGEDTTVPYKMRFDNNRSQDPFVVEWLSESVEDKKRIEDKAAQLNSIFKKSIEYWPGTLYESPSCPSRRYLRKEDNQMHEIFQTMEEIGIDPLTTRAMLKNLLLSKFEMSDAIEALMEANYYAWEKIRAMENSDRVSRYDFQQLRQEHDYMKIEIKKLKDDINIQ